VDRTLIHGNDRATLSFLDEFLGDGDTVVAHTSGSTGAPKAIRLSKEAMRLSARATNAFFGIGSGAVMACPLSADYIAGKMMIVRALEAKACLWMLPARRAGLLDGLPSDILAVALLPVVPAQLEQLLASPRSAIVRNVIVGGAPLSPEMELRLRDAPFQTYATYGMTETCSHVALRCISDGETMFTPMPGVEFTQDDRGCLVVNGLVTNDVVELVGRHFRWLGRADNVFISGGVKLNPEALEEALRREMPGLPAFYFTSRQSMEWGREAVMVTLDSNIDNDVVMAACRRVLPRAGVPKEIIFDPTPEYTRSGKIKRRVY